MTKPTDRTGSRGSAGWLIAGLYLMLCAATGYSVYKLSTDDCTTVATTSPDGSRFESKTCS